MGQGVVWRVQAHWTVGSEARSYAPVFVASETEALATAEEIAATLAHFPTLEVRVEAIDGSAADAEIAQSGAQRGHIERLTVHLLSASGRGTVCGAEIDQANPAINADLLALSDGANCSRCQEALSTSG